MFVDFADRLRTGFLLGSKSPEKPVDVTLPDIFSASMGKK
jgi:hypothetical protein